jgi:hypothetical protein
VLFVIRLNGDDWEGLRRDREGEGERWAMSIPVLFVILRMISHPMIESFRICSFLYCRLASSDFSLTSWNYLTRIYNSTIILFICLGRVDKKYVARYRFMN